MKRPGRGMRRPPSWPGARWPRGWRPRCCSCAMKSIALRGELAALRRDLHAEIAHMRAAQTVSPLLNDAMQMANAGHTAASAIAERCGISRRGRFRGAGAANVLTFEEDADDRRQCRGRGTAWQIDQATGGGTGPGGGPHKFLAFSIAW